MRSGLFAVALTLCAAPSAFAEEGMWTFNRFPSDQLKASYNFSPDANWFEKVRSASLRLAQGCSASFVSGEGLVMTNHHCVERCVEELSTPENDLVQAGFYAKDLKDERACPNFEVNQLLRIEEVTDRVMKAGEGKDSAEALKARRAEIAKIESECATSDKLRCDVVELYNGGVYDLYVYQRYQDARLVWAPEIDIAFFGGDPDNFMFPRHNLDAAFLRVYEDGKPVKPKTWFKWSKDGAKAGELTFTSGNPGRTSRLKTIAELRAEHGDVLLPTLLYLAEQRGMLVEYGKRGKEQARHSRSALLRVENGLKAIRGKAEALFSQDFFALLESKEKDLRSKTAANPELAKTSDAWDIIASVLGKARTLYPRYRMFEGNWGLSSDLFTHARTLLRAGDELAKPNQERLREFTEGRLPALEQRVLSKSPIYNELEEARLAFGLNQMRERLGSDDALVRKILGKESPEQFAKRVVSGSTLGDVAVREQLWRGGKDAVAASKDPMIELARLVDEEARKVRTEMEREVEAVIREQHTRISAARFAIYGTSAYPDATFTPRLSFGSVKAWNEGGKELAPFTTMGQIFERDAGAPPFAVPQSWWNAQSKLKASTPFNLSTTNDIIGGNSGSPLLNKNAEIIGLIFDGNIHSLGGDYGFDPAVNRAVSVDSRAILHSLEVIYKADRIVKELKKK